MKRKRLLGLFIMMMLLLQTIFSGIPVKVKAEGKIIFVDTNAQGEDNGSNWENAYNDLQKALNEAQFGDQIWIAKGTYKPKELYLNSPRSATFQMKDGISIYGGFAGNENDLNERDIKHNITILSGALDSGVNAYHVIYNNNIKLAKLDGVTISGGKADEGGDPTNNGGGMYNKNSSLIIENVKFEDNEAKNLGGGMYNINSSLTLINVVFENNSASNGGGMYNHNMFFNEDKSRTKLTKVQFLNNRATNSGAGMYNDNSNPIIDNVLFDGNEVRRKYNNGEEYRTGSGGGIFNYESSPTLKDVIFKRNSANSGGGMKNDKNSKPTLEDVTFENNDAYDGGGMYNNNNSGPILERVEFKSNTADHNGGGMYNTTIFDTTTLSNVLFSGNMAYNMGGAISNFKSHLSLTNVDMIGNKANYFGGGISNINSNPILENVTIGANTSLDPSYPTYSWGGGMYNETSSPKMTNVVIYKNNAYYGGGIFNNMNSHPELINVTISGNTANDFGGLISYENSTQTIINSIIIGNENDTEAHIVESSSEIRHSLIGEFEKGKLYDGSGIPSDKEYSLLSIFKDPMNNDPEEANYRLKMGSPAIDVGDDTFNSTQVDLDGNKRVFGEEIDLGAYEYPTPNVIVTMESNNGKDKTKAKANDEITLEIQTNLPIETPTLKIADETVTFTQIDNEGKEWRAIYTVKEEINDGPISFEIYIDYEGNQEVLTEESLETGIIIDNTPPVIRGIQNGNVKREATLEITEGTGILKKSNTVIRTFHHGELVEVTEEGDYTVEATDDIGNTATIHFTIDATPPKITISGVENNQTYRQVTPIITTDDEKADVKPTLKRGESIIPFESGSLISQAGNYTLTVEATDLAGNKSVETINFKISSSSSSGGGGGSQTSNTLEIIREVVDGIVQYRANLSQEVAQTLRSRLNNETNKTIEVNYPDETSSVRALLQVSKEASSIIADKQANIQIQTGLSQILVPSSSLNGINEDVYFRIIPRPELRENILKNAEQVGKLMPNHAVISLLDTPFTIETNLQNKPVTITIPISTSLTNEQMETLVLYIEHSDGTTEALKGRIVELPFGGKGVQFEANRSSTFALLYASDIKEIIIQSPYIKGYPDGTFKPNASVTRAQIASMLARYLTNGQIPTAEATFTDTVGHDAKDAIEYVKKTGLFKGKTETTFEPNGTITRAQMATVVARWVDKVCAEGSIKSYCTASGHAKDFTDVSATHWAYEAIQKVSALGIMTGSSETTFNPEGNLTRAQAVKVLNRLFEREPVETTNSSFSDVGLDHWAIGEIEAAATERVIEK